VGVALAWPAAGPVALLASGACGLLVGGLGRLARRRREGGGAAELVEAVAGAASAGPSSLAAPLVGASLLLPLTLHLLPAAALSTLAEGVRLQALLEGFGYYMVLSTLTAGFGYVVLALRSRAFARALSGAGAKPGPRAALAAVGWASVASLVPGLFLLGIPSLMVAGTGAAFVPLSFRWARRRGEQEARVLRAAVDGAMRADRDESLATAERVALDPSWPPPSRACAAEVVGAWAERARQEQVLDALLADVDARMRGWALERAFVGGHRPPQALLREMAETDAPERAARAVELLGRAHGEEAEATLLRLLALPEERVRLAALAALGSYGSVQAIAGIERALERFPTLDAPTHAAGRAIRRIQQRHAHRFERGSLALVEPEGGGLALADGAPV
jgi:hypothetical protein